MTKSMKKSLVASFALTLMMFSFQNCGEAFDASQSEGFRKMASPQDIQSIEEYDQSQIPIPGEAINPENLALENPSDEASLRAAQVPVGTPAYCENQVANYLRNGSFEPLNENSDFITGRWQVVRDIEDENGVISWYTDEGAGIEIQKSGVSKFATDGNYVVELDSHGQDSNSRMSQDVVMGEGQYILTFDSAARNQDPNDNGIEVLVDDELVLQIYENSKSWNSHEIPLQFDEFRSYKISFRAIGKQNTVGAVIDNIQLRTDFSNCP